MTTISYATVVIHGRERGYAALHRWMSRNFPRVGRCEFCGQRKRTVYGVARASHYTRNRADWFELCHRCHNNFDGGQTKAAAARRNQTHCVHGHLYTPANTYIDPAGGRRCRICIRHQRKGGASSESAST